MQKRSWTVFFLLFILSACAPISSSTAVAPIGPTPSLHPLFGAKTSEPAFPTSPPLTPTILPTETPLPAASNVVTNTIFGDTLDTNWTLEPSAGLTVDQETPIAVFAGREALTLSGAGGVLLFRVKPEARVQFSGDEVLTIRFWLYSGDDTVQLDDLWVEVFGSDQVFYWVKNDQSALTGLKTFSGKMYYGLGLNGDLPPNTWELIEISLETLVYDPYFDETPVELPEYTYFTGFALHLGETFEGTVALDEVSLLTVK